MSKSVIFKFSFKFNSLILKISVKLLEADKLIPFENSKRKD